MKANQVQEHFSKQASEYESLMVKLVPDYLEQHEIIADLLPGSQDPLRVLDLGCGNGVLSEIVRRKLPNAHIVGFDLTQEMLEVFSQKLSRKSGPFETIQGDFKEDSWGDQYDIVLAGLCLHHLNWKERERCYAKLFTSLNQPGLFIARDIILDEDPAVVQDQYELWKNHMSLSGEDPDFWYDKHIAKDHPMTLSDHFLWLQNAGFTKMACPWRKLNFAITTAVK